MLQADRIVIIGTGLLGASIGLGLKRRGFAGEIVGVGRRPETLAAATARGAIDRAATRVADAVLPGALVILATPLSGFPDALDALARTGAAAIVTDVGSTKVRVLQEAATRLTPSQRFVGAHPMAGGEQQGPDGARSDLFEGKPCVIVPGQSADGAAIGLVESLWRALGMTLLRMTADDHDAAVATISHVPHLASAALVAVAARRGGWDVASTGFRDGTRLASGSPTMWRDIIEWNRAAVRDTLRDLRGEIDHLLTMVDGADDAALLAWLESAKTRRDDWLATRPGVRGGCEERET